jgi:signal transduction histidine kinase
VLTGPLLHTCATDASHADAAYHACPNLIVDAEAAVILKANDAAWRAWGLSGQPVRLPLVLDRAMPGLQRLHDLAREGRDSATETLVVWTASGIMSAACRVTRLQQDGNGAVFVVVMPPQPGAIAPRAGRLRPALPSGVTRTAALAHEVKTPLGAIMAYAEILKDEHFGPLANERYQRYARDIYEAARHMLRVVDAMLHDGCAGAPEQQLDVAKVDLERLLDSCLSMVRPLAERSGLALSSEVQPGLPPVAADELTLKQMLLNLLSNAIKYARFGDRVCASIVAAADGSLHLSVTDTGPGIGRAALIGTDHAQGGRDTGLGLGLRLTHDLAVVNGARLTIENDAGGGTRATISFNGSGARQQCGPSGEAK